MYLGIPNPNILVPLEKMTISPEKDPEFEVLYNPESYTQSRQVMYQPPMGFSYERTAAQFVMSGAESLSFRLFFDTFSAGSEVGGGTMNKVEFSVNSLMFSAAKALDVRRFTRKVTNLLLVHEKLHRPQRVTLSWSSLQFVGYLTACQQSFVKFSEVGMPVRAWLDCTFIEALSPLAAKLGSGLSLGSPDTTKYHTVCQGESLWSMSVEAYGQPEQWRLIADANGISNPRRLRSGETLRMPALKK